jgi:hypothetical protein
MGHAAEEGTGETAEFVFQRDLSMPPAPRHKLPSAGVGILTANDAGMPKI